MDHRCARAMLEGLPSVVWFMRREMRKHRAGGVSVPQFRALVQLDRFDNLTLSSMAENLGCSLPTASRMVDKMTARKLVRRCVCPEDRRRMTLSITPRGRVLLKAARRGTEGVIAGRIASLSMAQKRVIISVMDTLRSTFDAEVACDWGADRTLRRNGARRARPRGLEAAGS